MKERDYNMSKRYRISPCGLINGNDGIYKIPSDLTDAELAAMELYISYCEIHFKAVRAHDIYIKLSAGCSNVTPDNAGYVVAFTKEKLVTLENSCIFKRLIDKVRVHNNIMCGIYMPFAKYLFEPPVFPIECGIAEEQDIMDEFNALGQTRSYMLQLVSMDKPPIPRRNRNFGYSSVVFKTPEITQSQKSYSDFSIGKLIGPIVFVVVFIIIAILVQ